MQALGAVTFLHCFLPGLSRCHESFGHRCGLYRGQAPARFWNQATPGNSVSLDRRQNSLAKSCFGNPPLWLSAAVAVYPTCPGPLSAWRPLGSVATSSPLLSVTGCLASGCWPLSRLVASVRHVPWWPKHLLLAAHPLLDPSGLPTIKLTGSLRSGQSPLGGVCLAAMSEQ